jgi:hypothetical protein
MRYKNLEFFTKDGDSANFNYNEELERWEGSLFIPKVSVDLFETEHLFAYERIINNDDGLEYYGKPHIYNYDISSSIYLVWEDDLTPELSLFTVGDDMYINKLVSLEIDLDHSSSDTLIYDQLHSDLITEEYIQLNISSNSHKEGIFENTLYIKDKNDDHIIAQIEVYAEAEGEDLRLKTLCNNLGYFISPQDEKIFSESDIEEDLMNFNILNRKRKEILLEGSNIFPFIGSYKGLINAINFFGFTDLTVREYWKNIDVESKDFGKYKQSEVLEIFNSDVNLSTELVDTRYYRKKNRIALVFQLYDVYENDLDKYELPTVEENFRYTIEEVLIKLFALKDKLKKTFLPYNITIQDIIAEGTYFSKTNKTYNTSHNHMLTLDKGVQPKFDLLSNNDLILDLRDLDELIFQYEFDPYFEHDLRARTYETAEDWGDYISALFTDYYPTLNTLENLPDKDNIPIGCPIVVRNTTFDYAIKDIDAMLKKFNSDNDYVIDFEVKDPLLGDTYVLEETESNTKIEYEVTSTISEDDLTEELFTLFSNQTQLPWVLFLPQIVTKDSKKYLRIEARDVSSNNISFNFEPYIIDGFGNRDEGKFNKYFITTSNSYTMDNIGTSNYYEIEWRIYKDDLSFDYSIRGSLDQYETLAVVLTKQGLHNLELKLYNTDNLVSRKVFPNFIDVKMKSAEFLGVYRRISDKYHDLKSLENIAFRDNKFVSSKPLIVQETQLKDCNLTFNTLNRISLLPNTNFDDNYLYTAMNFRPSKEISYPGPFTFASMGKNISIKDLRYVTNRWTMLAGDTPASFDIKEINVGGVLVISDLLTNEKGTHIFQTDDLKLAVEELNSSEDQIISKYIYNYVDNDEGHFPDSHLASYIHVAGKYHGQVCDWKQIDFENIVLENIEPSRDYGYRINDFEILNNFRAFNGAVYIQFAPDNSGIPGKVGYKWVVRNISNEVVDDVIFDNNTMGYLFHREGNYQIELTVTDNQGNSNTVFKNWVKII